LSIRPILGLVTGALVCVIGALILGEYEFNGVTPVASGILFGLVISEIVLEVGARRHPVIGVLSAAMVAGALAWAGYVSSGEGLRPFPNGAWVAMACGAVAAGIRTGGWSARRPTDVTNVE
jgi:ABC-type cobalamin transport system permease subunit